MGRHQADPADGAGRAHAPGRELTPLALDLDGTLIDARLRQVGVAAEALAALCGETLPEARFWRAKRAGATTREAMLRLGHPPAVAGALAARWAERIEADDWLERDRPLPGVARALARLRAAEVEICVLTARRRAPGARRSLAAAGLDGLVDELVVVDPALSARAKADALAARGAVAFVGDTESDGAAAALAGVPFVAVAIGQRAPAYLRARGYEVARRLAEALERLDFGIVKRDMNDHTASVAE